MTFVRRFAAGAVLLFAAVAAADPPCRRLALLAGVQNYDGTEFASLRFAERDVTELATVLREAKYDEVVLLTDAAVFEEKNETLFPTAVNIRRHLDALLALLGPGDTLVVAFAGHGVQLEKPAGMFFCPKGADLADLKSLVALDAVYAALKSKKDGFRLLLVDACRNDPLTSRSKTVDNLKSVSRPALPKPPQGVAALFSCSAGERAYEDEKSKHGFFFRHVLDGLRGGAADSKGDVKVPALAQYVVDSVPLSVRQRFQNPNVVQKPEAFFEGQSPVLVSGAKAAAPEPNAPRGGGNNVRLVRAGAAKLRIVHQSANAGSLKTRLIASGQKVEVQERAQDSNGTPWVRVTWTDDDGDAAGWIKVEELQP